MGWYTVTGTTNRAIGATSVSLVIPTDGTIFGVEWSAYLFGGGSDELYAALANAPLTSAECQAPQGAGILSRYHRSQAQAAAGQTSSVSNFFVPMLRPVVAGEVLVVSAVTAALENQVTIVLHIGPPRQGPRGPDVVGEAASVPVKRIGLQSVTTESQAASGFDDLKHRVIRADQAVFCCRNSLLKAAQAVNGVLLDAYRVIEGLERDQQVYAIGGVLATGPTSVRTASGALTSFEELLSRPVNVTNLKEVTDFNRLISQNLKPVRALPKGAAITPGAVALVLGVTAASYFIDVSAKTAALETFSFISAALNTGVRTQDCVECVRKRMLPQAAPRKKLTARINRRL